MALEDRESPLSPLSNGFGKDSREPIHGNITARVAFSK